MSLNIAAILANRNRLQISSLAWAMFIGFTLLWCLAYSDIVLKNGRSFSAAFYCVIQNWVLWAGLTPLVFRYLDRLTLCNTLKRRHYLVLGFTLVGFTICSRIAMERLWGDASVAETLASHIHEYVVAAVVVLSSWRLVLYPRLKENGGASQNPQANQEKIIDTQKTQIEPREEGIPAPLSARNTSAGIQDKLWVHKGADRCLIAVDNIQYACAARNYVELFCQGDSYLLRSTLNDLEKSLPAIFTRTHRSIIVNIHHIERVKYLPSGSGTAILRCGNSVPVSKRYLAEMRKYKNPNKP